MTVIQSTLLSDAYKSQAELEVQLNVAKSNLQLVISNNEMLLVPKKSNGQCVTDSRMIVGGVC